MQTNEYKPYPHNLPQDLQTVLLIIDDGLSQGFEFKVENHNLYFRDTFEPPTKC